MLRRTLTFSPGLGRIGGLGAQQKSVECVAALEENDRNHYPPHARQVKLHIYTQNYVQRTSLLAMYNVPYRKLRPISTPRLNALQRLHLVPINQIISLGT